MIIYLLGLLRKNKIVIRVIFLTFAHQHPNAAGGNIYMNRFNLLELIVFSFVFYHSSGKVIGYTCGGRATSSSAMIDKLI